MVHITIEPCLPNAGNRRRPYPGVLISKRDKKALVSGFQVNGGQCLHYSPSHEDIIVLQCKAYCRYNVGCAQRTKDHDRITPQYRVFVL